MVFQSSRDKNPIEGFGRLVTSITNAMGSCMVGESDTCRDKGYNHNYNDSNHQTIEYEHYICTIDNEDEYEDHGTLKSIRGKTASFDEKLYNMSSVNNNIPQWSPEGRVTFKETLGILGTNLLNHFSTEVMPSLAKKSYSFTTNDENNADDNFFSNNNLRTTSSNCSILSSTHEDAYSHWEDEMHDCTLITYCQGLDFDYYTSREHYDVLFTPRSFSPTAIKKFSLRFKRGHEELSHIEVDGGLPEKLTLPICQSGDMVAHVELLIDSTKLYVKKKPNKSTKSTTDPSGKRRLLDITSFLPSRTTVQEIFELMDLQAGSLPRRMMENAGFLTCQEEKTVTVKSKFYLCAGADFRAELPMKDEYRRERFKLGLTAKGILQGCYWGIDTTDGGTTKLCSIGGYDPHGMKRGSYLLIVGATEEEIQLSQILRKHRLSPRPGDKYFLKSLKYEGLREEGQTTWTISLYKNENVNNVLTVPLIKLRSNTLVVEYKNQLTLFTEFVRSGCQRNKQSVFVNPKWREVELPERIVYVKNDGFPNSKDSRKNNNLDDFMEDGKAVYDTINDIDDIIDHCGDLHHSISNSNDSLAPRDTHTIIDLDDHWSDWGSEDEKWYGAEKKRFKESLGSKKNVDNSFETKKLKKQIKNKNLASSNSSSLKQQSFNSFLSPNISMSGSNITNSSNSLSFSNVDGSNKSSNTISASSNTISAADNEEDTHDRSSIIPNTETKISGGKKQSQTRFTSLQRVAAINAVRTRARQSSTVTMMQ